MRRLIRQSDQKYWPITTGPFVVLAHEKNVMKNMTNTAAGHASAYSRDGPIIFHMRDGPPNVTGPPGGTGPPKYHSDSGPPKTTGPPMEWLVRKKSLKKPSTISKETSGRNKGKLKHFKSHRDLFRGKHNENE